MNQFKTATYTIIYILILASSTTPLSFAGTTKISFGLAGGLLNINAANIADSDLATIVMNADFFEEDEKVTVEIDAIIGRYKHNPELIDKNLLTGDQLLTHQTLECCSALITHLNSNNTTPFVATIVPSIDTTPNYALFFYLLESQLKKSRKTIDLNIDIKQDTITVTQILAAASASQAPLPENQYQTIQHHNKIRMSNLQIALLLLAAAGIIGIGSFGAWKLANKIKAKPTAH